MKAKLLSRAITALAICLFMLAGCGKRQAGQVYSDAPGGTGGHTQTDKPIIAVTIVPQETFVKAVCGELAEVLTLVPPGNSPENYEPTPTQMEQLSAASLYFTIGVPVESADIIGSVGEMKTISLRDEVAALYPERSFESGGRDPHIWLSPKRVMVMVEAIARELSALDDENKETYQANAGAYIQQLEQLDKEITSALEGVSNRKFIVYHPAFGYLAEDYDLTMYSLEEEGKEATPRHLADMIDLAKSENIKAIFYQEEIDSSQSKAFAEEIGGRTIQLSPLAADYIENLKAMAQLMAEVMQ